MSGETLEGRRTKRFDVALEWLTPNEYRVDIIFHYDGTTAPTLAVSSVYRRVSRTGPETP